MTRLCPFWQLQTKASDESTFFFLPYQQNDFLLSRFILWVFIKNGAVNVTSRP